jgi:serine protease
MKVLLLAASLWLGAVPAFSQSHSPADAYPYERGVVTVKLAEGLSADADLPGLLAAGKDVPGVLSVAPAFVLHPRTRVSKRPPDLSRIFRVHIDPDLDPVAEARRLSRLPGVEYAEAVPVVRLSAFGTEDLYAMMQHLAQVRASEAWALLRGSSGPEVILAVTDSSVEWYHPDLAPYIWRNAGEDANGNGTTLVHDGSAWVLDPGDMNGIDDDGNGYIDDLIGWNFSGAGNNNPFNPDPHGTQVAAIASFAAGNGFEADGEHPMVRIMPVSSFDYAQLTFGNPYQSVIYAAENGAHVINASWGSEVYSRANEEVIAYAMSLGVVVVAAAGNQNDTVAQYPASSPGVVSVASLSVTDARAAYSSYGPTISLSAPGGQLDMFSDRGIVTLTGVPRFRRVQGTSMAAPIVAAVAAMIMRKQPDWPAAKIISQLLASADDIGDRNAGLDGMLGRGRVNALRAVGNQVVTLDALRLHLARVEFDDENGDGLLTVGEAIDVHVRVAHLVPSPIGGEVELRLESGSPYLQVETGPVTVAVEQGTSLHATFRVRLLEGARTGTLPATLRASAITPVEIGAASTIDVPVAAGGVLVWDARPNERFFSGRYIYGQLQAMGIPSMYLSSEAGAKAPVTFPASLAPFDAVFLCFGAGEASGNTISTLARNQVEAYLRAGGRVYIEGAMALGDGAFQSSLTLLDVLGIASIDRGPFEKAAPERLTGGTGSVLEGYDFAGYDQSPIRLVNRYIPSTSGTAAIDEPGFGVVAQQASGEFGQRAFVSSYALVNVRDSAFPSNRRNALWRILDHLGVAAPSAAGHLDFVASARSGHAPLAVTFSDRSGADASGLVRHWDIDGSGTASLAGEQVSWVYERPGVYTVELSVGEGEFEQRHRRDGFVQVFDGNSSLEFGAGGTRLVLPAEYVIRLMLNNTFTLEAWILPAAWGTRPSGYGRILDKLYLMLFLEDDGRLVLGLETPMGEAARRSTGAGVIRLNEWQHIAVSYTNGVARMYVNGIEQAVEASGAPITEVRSLITQNILVGNNPGGNQSFVGRIDEVRIWNAVRTGAEVLAHMNAPLTGSEALLAGYWPLDDAAGTVAMDRGAFGYHGRVDNAAWRAGYGEIPVSAVDLSPSAPGFELHNYPNPFASFTTVEFILPSAQRIRIALYNALGQRVGVLLDEHRAAGAHAVTFDAAGIASGLYILRLETETHRSSRRVIVVK